jgi:hypothetical protein
MGLAVDAAGNLYVATLNYNYGNGDVPDSALAGGSVIEISGNGFVPASDSSPSLIAQPVNQTGVASQSVGFTAAAGGYPDPTIQWQASSDGGRTFSDITGNLSATTPTLTLNGLTASQNGTKYRAIFANGLGFVTTETVKLAVVPLALVSLAHASPSSVTGTTTTLSALADATAGESGLTYKWSIVRVPAGAARPTFSANGTNAARHTVVKFHKDGRYEFRCDISDGHGDIVKSDVQVEVAQTATSLRLSPHDKTIATGENLAFHASLYDQFGHPLRTQPTPTYSVLNGPGTINPTSGLFSSDAPGAALIQADDGDLSGTAGVGVIA